MVGGSDIWTDGAVRGVRVSALLTRAAGAGRVVFLFCEDSHASMLAGAAALPPDIRCRPLAHSSTLGDWFYCVCFSLFQVGIRWKIRDLSRTGGTADSAQMNPVAH